VKRAASALDHPNICTTHDIGEHEGRRFIVMQLLERQTLKHRIGGRPMPLDELLDIGAQVADTQSQLPHLLPAEGRNHDECQPE
jgi:serine/threonine protein kinase